MQCNTAIFYDIENLIYLFAVKTTTILQLDEIHRRILEIDGVSGVSIQKAYADWALQINRNLRGSVLQIGIEPIQIFNTNQNDRVKNAADVSLIIDAVELLTKHPEVQNYVIVSGDGIYAFLAKKLHEYGKRVIGVGFERNTNIIFRNACDYFVSLEKSDKKLISVISKTAKGKAQIPQPEIAPPADSPAAAEIKLTPSEKKALAKKIPRKFPRIKFSEILTHADIEVWNDPNNLNGALLVIRDVVNTLFEEGADESAASELDISVFKTYVDYYVPGFKVSQYKYKRFRDFMRFMLTNSPYCVYQAEGTTLKLARRGSVGSKGTVMPDLRSLEITLAGGKKTNSVFNIPEHTSFTYAITDQGKEPAKPKQRRGPRQANKQKAAEAVKAAGGKEAASAAVETEAAAPAKKTRAPRKPRAKAAPKSAVIIEIPDDSSIRKFIKESFQKLSADNSLALGEVKRLMTPEYSQQTFGIKTPILKEIDSKSNLEEKRAVNGKLKYWKELFKYNNRTYLVFKEWTAPLHKDRFITWLEMVETKAAKKKKG